MKHFFKLVPARIRWFIDQVKAAYWTYRILQERDGLDQARKAYHGKMIERERTDPNGAETNRLRGKVEILDELLALPYND